MDTWLSRRLKAIRREQGGSTSQRGQALVETVVVTPLLLLIAFAAAEFGLLYQHYLTLSYATREGARVGASLANSSSADTAILDAVEVATETLDHSLIVDVKIYKADANGGMTTGLVNTYVWNQATSSFALSGSVQWSPMSRVRTLPTDPLGIQIRYQHQWLTGSWIGGGFVVVDRTVMRIDPA